jgi:hypothetical protein
MLLFNAGCIDNNPTSTDNTDTQAPTISILYPVNNSIIKADTTYTIIADAQDNKSVSYIDFYIDDSKVGSDSSLPYQYSWNTTGKAGDHSIMAKAFDAAGNTDSSLVIAVKVKAIVINNPPDIPYNPSPVKNAIGVSILSSTLSWSCSDPEGDAITYDVFFGTSNPPTAQIAAGQSAASLACTGLASSTTYYWQVNAKDSKNAVTTGPVWYFKTQLKEFILPATIGTIWKYDYHYSEIRGGFSIASTNGTHIWTLRSVFQGDGINTFLIEDIRNNSTTIYATPVSGETEYQTLDTVQFTIVQEDSSITFNIPNLLNYSSGITIQRYNVSDTLLQYGSWLSFEFVSTIGLRSCEVNMGISAHNMETESYTLTEFIKP